MKIRPRRLRRNKEIRCLTRETRLSPNQLILPLFIKEGINEKEPISSLKGHYYYNKDNVCEGVEEAINNNITSVILFGVPKVKQIDGSGAYDEKGEVQEAIREIKKHYPNMFVITDVCLCEYKTDGHCGIVKDGVVLNDESLPLLAHTALSHAQAGADMVAPSDMMDGRVSAIRLELDKNGYDNIPILAYSAKYASSFYGPFRDVAGSAPSFGDRKTYQMDYHNKREGVKEALLDIEEGADIVMVKPALSYLDIISEIKRTTNIPVCAYSVSGEYAMIKAGAELGYIDEHGIMCESAVSIFRSGADMLITYYAKELAQAIKTGEIG